MMPNLLFDHAVTVLDLAERTLGFERITTTSDDDAKDAEAATALLDRNDWTLAFVHIHEGPWKSLFENAPKNRVIVRFSTEGFPPSGPEGNNALCIRCIKRIDKQLTEDDLRLLSTELLKDTVLDELRSGSVPGKLSSLVCFESPHYIRALHIMSQAALAVWACDPEHKRHKDALGILRLETLPMGRPSTQLTKVLFRDAIGQKPGVSELPADKELRAFVEDLYNDEATTILPDEDTLLAAFKTIDNRLRM